MTPAWYTRRLTVTDPPTGGGDVLVVQRKVGSSPTGAYDGATASRVRAVQKVHGLPPDGEVGPDTAQALGPRATEGLLPDWWDEDREYHVRRRLAYGGPNLADALRRFQSARGLPLSGRVDEATAVALGD